jgi:hypothetical protein
VGPNKRVANSPPAVAPVTRPVLGIEQLINIARQHDDHSAACSVRSWSVCALLSSCIVRAAASSDKHSKAVLQCAQEQSISISSISSFKLRQYAQHQFRQRV